MNNQDKGVGSFENMGEGLEAAKQGFYTFYKDYIKLLYNLTEIFKHCIALKTFPKIKFKNFPDLNNAR